MVAMAAPVVAAPVFAQYGSSVQGIAEREVARRMGRIEDARKAMQKGDELYADDKVDSALSQYRSAKEIFDGLPNAPYIQDWRDLCNLKFADCAAVEARHLMSKGDYEQARTILNEAIVAVPKHGPAKKALRHLEDPDRWPPALTPEHVENVDKVKKGLLIASSAVELGNYDEGIQLFEDVLRIDPYNTAARRGMELAERKRSEYLEAARNHARVKMLNDVNGAWEFKPAVKDFRPESAGVTARRSDGAIMAKINSIRFPKVQFDKVSIEEAVDFLRTMSQNLDTTETDPARRGVNIILKAGDAAAATSTISLDVRDVPMTEALRYVTELAGMKYKIEPNAVLIVPLSDTSSEQYTRTYKVGPDFLSIGGGGGAAPAPAAGGNDPFGGGGAAAPASGLVPKKAAIDILKDQGIPFPEGATAFFNPVNSTLIVKNTQPNLDLVEAFVDTLRGKQPKQVSITSKFVEVTQKNTDELGFDWLLGGAGNNIEIGGGTTGNSGVRANYTGTLGDMVTGGAVSPVTRALRSGSRAIRGDSIDSLFNPVAAGADTVAPGILSVAGIFTDPQFGMVLRALSQRKGVDLMSAPSVTTKSGQRATIEVVREFIYPTEFDPPQIPTNVGATNGGGGGVGGGTVGSIPVTPTTPTAFEMRQVGVRMEVDPTISEEGGTIDLNLAPEVTEFDGFINYGSPIFSVQPLTDAFGFTIGSTQVELTPNIINQPIFSTRKVTTSVTIWDGQTVALGGLIREDVQDVEDKIPVLGDLPLVGRLFRSEAEDHFKRNLMIFVTAKLIDPAGQPIRLNSGGGAGAGAAEANLLLPPVN